MKMDYETNDQYKAREEARMRDEKRRKEERRKRKETERICFERASDMSPSNWYDF